MTATQAGVVMVQLALVMNVATMSISLLVVTGTSIYAGVVCLTTVAKI